MSARTLDGNFRGPDCSAAGTEFESYEGDGSTGLRAWHAVRVLSGPPPGPTVPGISWRRANGAELAGFGLIELVSSPVPDDETPVCAALSPLGKFRFPAAFECPTGDWFESYEPSSLLCLRDGVRYDWVPGTQFESSQVHHALFRTARFPGDGQGARQLAGSCGCVLFSAETVSGLKAILGGLSLGRGIPFPRCRSILNEDWS
jgi:hypothetical protein